MVLIIKTRQLSTHQYFTSSAAACGINNSSFSLLFFASFHGHVFFFTLISALNSRHWSLTKIYSGFLGDQQKSPVLDWLDSSLSTHCVHTIALIGGSRTGLEAQWEPFSPWQATWTPAVVNTPAHQTHPNYTVKKNGLPWIPSLWLWIQRRGLPSAMTEELNQSCAASRYLSLTNSCLSLVHHCIIYNTVGSLPLISELVKHVCQACVSELGVYAKLYTPRRYEMKQWH